jgi:hypothetical protein
MTRGPQPLMAIRGAQEIAGRRGVVPGKPACLNLSGWRISFG